MFKVTKNKKASIVGFTVLQRFQLIKICGILPGSRVILFRWTSYRLNSLSQVRQRSGEWFDNRTTASGECFFFAFFFFSFFLRMSVYAEELEFDACFDWTWPYERSLHHLDVTPGGIVSERLLLHLVVIRFVWWLHWELCGCNLLPCYILEAAATQIECVSQCRQVQCDFFLPSPVHIPTVHNTGMLTT